MNVYGEANDLAREIVDGIQRDHPDAEPMQIILAMAIAIGAMAGSLNEMGVIKQGQAGKMLAHLFKISESTFIAGAA